MRCGSVELSPRDAEVHGLAVDCQLALAAVRLCVSGADTRPCKKQFALAGVLCHRGRSFELEASIVIAPYLLEESPRVAGSRW